MQAVIQKKNKLKKPLVKSRVSALLPVFLLDEVEKVSQKNNITKSYIIEKALQDWFLKKLDTDTKDLAKISFDDLPSEKGWDLIQSRI